MLKCAVLDDYQDAARQFADWSPLDGRVRTTFLRHNLGGRAAVVAALADFEIIVAMRERTRFDRETLALLPRLKLLVTTGPVNAAIDMTAAREQGITVCGTRGNRSSTAELTWALILNATRRIGLDQASVRAGGWQTGVGTALAGRRLGLLGLGHIGGQVARIGQAFGMEVAAFSPNLTPARAAEAGVIFCPEMDRLFSESDVISLHLGLGETTRGIVTLHQLRLMRPDAWLVNTARAELVQEASLMQALAERWFAGAALDVFHHEPLPQDSPLRYLPNVVATPHVGYVADSVYRLYHGDTVEDILRWLDSAPVRVL